MDEPENGYLTKKILRNNQVFQTWMSIKRENGKYFLYATIKNTKKVTCENQARIVAIDPGIRTFATFYSGDTCGKIGEADYTRIARLCLDLDLIYIKELFNSNDIFKGISG